jgi:hypothetical protein
VSPIGDTTDEFRNLWLYNNANIGGKTNIGGNLNVGDSVKVSGPLNLQGGLYVNDSAYIFGNTSIGGIAAADGFQFFSNSNFSVAYPSGNITTRGTITASGNITSLDGEVYANSFTSNNGGWNFNNDQAPSSGQLVYWNGTEDAYETPTIGGTANNGISINSNVIQLGGTLIKNTDIPLAGYNLTFSGSGNVGIGTSSPAAMLSVGPTSQFQVDNAGNVTVNTLTFPNAYEFSSPDQNDLNLSSLDNNFNILLNTDNIGTGTFNLTFDGNSSPTLVVEASGATLSSALDVTGTVTAGAAMVHKFRSVTGSPATLNSSDYLVNVTSGTGVTMPTAVATGQVILVTNSTGATFTSGTSTAHVTNGNTWMMVWEGSSWVHVAIN